uniref:Uncharacterized protein n=1 Tax=Panstrongylus lignarius TaxID=156445 RepID=A0A224XQJ6_9HEMI
MIILAKDFLDILLTVNGMYLILRKCFMIKLNLQWFIQWHTNLPENKIMNILYGIYSLMYLETSVIRKADSIALRMPIHKCPALAQKRRKVLFILGIMMRYFSC